MPLDDAEILAALRAALPELEAALLFGSHATGEAGPDSDVDLAVFAPTPIEPLRLWLAGEAVAQTLGCDVDLVDLRRASTVLQHQIIVTGRRLFAVGDDIERYEIYSLSAMTALNEARAPLLDDIQRDGRVYAV